ncbi:MAG: hypothetical protein ABI056_01805 [Caulobacteraceae bacterium]
MIEEAVKTAMGVGLYELGARRISAAKGLADRPVGLAGVNSSIRDGRWPPKGER